MKHTRFPRFFACLEPLPLAFCLIGALVAVRGLGLGTGNLSLPGPGLWPVITGCGLFAGGTALLAAAVRARPEGKSEPLPAKTPLPFGAAPPAETRALKGFALACGLWLALLFPLGWTAATALAMAAACRAAGNSVKETLALMILLIGGLYLGVDVLLHASLPRGLLFSFLARNLWGGL